MASDQGGPAGMRNVDDIIRGLEGASMASYWAAANELSSIDNLKERYGRKIRVALLGSSTLDPLRPCLFISLLKESIYADFYIGPYNQFNQEILNDESGLYNFRPDVVVIAAHAGAFIPSLDWAAAGPAKGEQEDAVAGIRALMERLSARLGSLVLFGDFIVPDWSPLSFAEGRHEHGSRETHLQMNLRIMEEARSFPLVRVLGMEMVASRMGKKNAFDNRLHLSSRIMYSHAFFLALSGEIRRCIRAYLGLQKKCLVLDLDNTLWGGLAGEEGLNGVRLGLDYPGNCYHEFQKRILALQRRGVMLCVSSKNNERDALDIMEKHPYMLLRPDCFAAMRINWQPKALGIQEMALELGIGLDSMVFMDDSPQECMLVSEALPEVAVIKLPEDASALVSVIEELDLFDTISVTGEDLVRNRTYSDDRKRRSLAGLGEERYLDGLGMALSVSLVDDFSEERALQLFQKTNQFNATTIRYKASEIAEMRARADTFLYVWSLRDRFGDLGIIGAAAVRLEGDEGVIESFVMSCRAMGRHVEDKALARIEAHLMRKGYARLRARILYTERNVPVRDLYRNNGYALVSEDANGSSWEKTPLLARGGPDYIECGDVDG